MAMASALAGPRGAFLIGNSLQLDRDPLAFLTRCARQYGDIVPVRLLKTTAFLLNHPDYVDQVLTSKHRRFRKGSSLRRILGEGLVTSEGELWRQQRQLAQPAFHRERLAAYGQVMVEAAERYMATWRDGETRDLYRDMIALTLEVATRTLFGVAMANHADQVRTAVEEVSRQLTAHLRILPIIASHLSRRPWHRYHAAVAALNEVTDAIIRERRASAEDGGDLLSMLLQARYEDGSAMSDTQLRDEARTLLLAGHEGTAMALSWTWYLLARHPEANAAMRAELRAVLGSRSPEVADLPRLPFTGGVVREALRLYPPVWRYGRAAVEDCEIGGCEIAKGNRVMWSQWVLHRDPRFYEDPEAFRPDRWADGLEKRLPRCAYLPFGAGPRHCIGHAFAMMEAVLVVGTIAQRFQLTRENPRPVVPWPSVNLRPKGGMPLVVTRSAN